MSFAVASSSSAAHIVGIGLATPPHTLDQSQAASLAVATTLTDPSQRQLVEGLFARAGVASRASAILSSTRSAGEDPDQTLYTPDSGASDSWPTTSARMSLYREHAGALSVLAARRALEDAKVDAREITHLIAVSCTGLEAPGVDVELMTSLQLSAGVQRLNLGFMGCHGGIVATRAAAALVESARGRVGEQRTPRVLAVCTELCSLHFQRTARGDQHVANALFGDGCAAIVVSEARGAADTGDLAICSASSRLFPDSTGAMGWRIGDHGFEMMLDRSVPALLQEQLGGWIWPWLQSEMGRSVTAGDIDWCVHPGGPRVLDAVQRGLGLDATSLEQSRRVLHDHGNMSSATVLFILDRLRRQAADARSSSRRPIVMLAFGPGLTGEAALLAPRG